MQSITLWAADLVGRAAPQPASAFSTSSAARAWSRAWRPGPWPPATRGQRLAGSGPPVRSGPVPARAAVLSGSIACAPGVAASARARRPPGLECVRGDRANPVAKALPDSVDRHLGHPRVHDQASEHSLCDADELSAGSLAHSINMYPPAWNCSPRRPFALIVDSAMAHGAQPRAAKAVGRPHRALRRNEERAEGNENGQAT